MGANADDREPVPSDAAQQQALTLVKEVYGQEWDAAKSSAQKQTLATKLLQKADESTDITNRYVLLDVARQMAAQTGDAELAFKAIDAMVSRYNVDAYKLRGAALSVAAKSTSSSSHSAAVAKLSLDLIDEAVEKDDFVAAKYLGDLAVYAARKGRNTTLVKEVIARNREVEETAKAYADTQDALATLKDSPVDPEANLVVGKYHCFIKGNWDRGLPMLALGSDEKVKELAIRELEGVPDADGQVALGDGWWELASKSEGKAKEQIEGRAGHWYRKATPGLTGLMKDRVEKRLVLVRDSKVEKQPTAKRRTIDCLSGLDVQQAASRGQWKVDKGRLLGQAPKGVVASITLGSIPFKHYDLQLWFIPMGKGGDIILGLPTVDAPMGLRQASVEKKVIIGFWQTDKKGLADSTVAARLPGLLQVGRRCCLEVTVRGRESLAVQLNGQRVLSLNSLPRVGKRELNRSLSLTLSPTVQVVLERCLVAEVDTP